MTMEAINHTGNLQSRPEISGVLPPPNNRLIEVTEPQRNPFLAPVATQPERPLTHVSLTTREKPNHLLSVALPTGENILLETAKDMATNAKGNQILSFEGREKARRLADRLVQATDGNFQEARDYLKLLDAQRVQLKNQLRQGVTRRNFREYRQTEEYKAETAALRTIQSLRMGLYHKEKKALKANQIAVRLEQPPSLSVLDQPVTEAVVTLPVITETTESLAESAVVFTRIDDVTDPEKKHETKLGPIQSRIKGIRTADDRDVAKAVDLLRQAYIEDEQKKHEQKQNIELNRALDTFRQDFALNNELEEKPGLLKSVWSRAKEKVTAIFHKPDELVEQRLTQIAQTEKVEKPVEIVINLEAIDAVLDHASRLVEHRQTQKTRSRFAQKVSANAEKALIASGSIATIMATQAAVNQAFGYSIINGHPELNSLVVTGGIQAIAIGIIGLSTWIIELDGPKSWHAFKFRLAKYLATTGGTAGLSMVMR
jgi:hypothetical protein